MRIQRHKHARKTLAFYRSVFDMANPYTVLVDGTFVHHCMETRSTV